MKNDSDLKSFIINIIKSEEVNTSIKSSVSEAVKESVDDFSRVSFIERQKAVQRNAFSGTEKLLYGFLALEEHLANEGEYLGMAFKESSGSVVRYSKNKVPKPESDQLVEDRKRSYERSFHDYERIKKALEAVSGEKGFRIIELKYLSDNDLTYADIAEKLAGTDGFSVNLSEKTVRKYKNAIVNKIALLLFGTDAI